MGKTTKTKGLYSIASDKFPLKREITARVIPQPMHSCLKRSLKMQKLLSVKLDIQIIKKGAKIISAFSKFLNKVFSIGCFIVFAKYKYKINKCPNSAATKCQKLDNTDCGVSCIEPVYTQIAEKETKKNGNKPAFSFRITDVLYLTAASHTDNSVIIYFISAF